MRNRNNTLLVVGCTSVFQHIKHCLLPQFCSLTGVYRTVFSFHFLALLNNHCHRLFNIVGKEGLAQGIKSLKTKGLLTQQHQLIKNLVSQQTYFDISAGFDGKKWLLW